jgi:hypothetical protein
MVLLSWTLVTVLVKTSRTSRNENKKSLFSLLQRNARRSWNSIPRSRLPGVWRTTCTFFMFWVWVYTNTEMVWDNRSHQNANILSLAPKMRRSTWVENASSHNNAAHQQQGMPARIKVLCRRWEEQLANSVVVVAVLTAQAWATVPE